MIGRAHILGLCACLAGPALAQDSLQLPDRAEQTFTDRTAIGQYALPTGPWADGGVPSIPLEGSVRRDVWQIADFQGGTGVLLAVLTGQLEANGFAETFSCTTRICGGFDFRFALDVAPEPEMHVNLADFAFFAAMRDGEAGTEHIALVVSQGGGIGFVEVVQISPPGNAAAEVTLSSRGPEPELAPPVVAQGLADMLDTYSRAPLPGVAFGYASTELTDPAAPALQDLARYLTDNPDLRVVLVGHTDAEGGLDSNINVSRARARAVRQVLIDDFGIAAGRLDAQGVGYLMPLAPNSTQTGRDQNRRVEVVVLNTE